MKIVLPRRVIKQPIPHINESGDCGPCGLAGVLGHTTEVRNGGGDIIRAIHKKYIEKGAVSLGRHGMVDALFKAQGNGEIEDFIDDTPTWSVWEVENQFGASGFAVSHKWFAYIAMAVRAGYYGLAMVDSDGRSGKGRECYGTDHWVMICGVRKREVPNKRVKGSSTIKSELLISNSSNRAKDERWIEAPEFLRRFGGYNAILVLPK